MEDFKTRLGPIAGAAMLVLAAESAQASLVLVSPENFSGTGLGSVNTILTLASPASTSFESGSVAFGNVTTGNVMTGASQTQTRTLGDLGVTSASNLRVVFNAVEPGNGDAGITLSNLVLNIYSPTGTVLFTTGPFTTMNFVTLEYLLPKLVAEHEKEIAQIAAQASQLDDEAGRIAQAYLDMKRRHLQTLTSQPA